MTTAAELDKAIEELLENGWIVRYGDIYKITPTGQAVLRRGIPGKTYGPTLPLASTRARVRLPNKKKKHRW